MKRSADFGCAVIRQGEPAAEQYKRRRKDGHGQNGHHEPQAEQCTGALGSNGACLLGIAGQPDQIQADAGQKNRHAGRSLYNKGLHREDNAFLTAPRLELAVVHTVGEEKGRQYAEHAVAGKYHHARHAEQCQTAGKARQAEQEQQHSHPAPTPDLP